MQEIYRFYSEKDQKAAGKIVDSIFGAVDKLSLFPQMASVEDMLAGLAGEYRSLVAHKSFKVIYFIDQLMDEVVILTIFDCRRNPEKLRKGILKNK